MKHRVICINRYSGSNGHGIGREVAERLGISFYDKELVDQAIEHGGLGDSKYLERFVNADESRPNDLFYRLFSEGNENVKAVGTSEDIIHQLETDLILKKAAEEDFVVMGRCAGTVLEENLDVELLRVFVTASEDYCIEKTMENYGMDYRAAKSKVRTINKSRKSYVQHFAKEEWLSSANYDLVLNVERLGEEKAVDILCTCYKDIMSKHLESEE